MAGSSISIVIPALNEERALGDTLCHVLTQQAPIEVIVVDGGSSDRTAEIAQQFPAVKLISARKGRASQMNAGAAAASGDWLVFLHADSRLPGDGLSRIRALNDDADVGAGGFLQRFSGEDWRLRLVSWLDNLRFRKTGIVYGDQALFVRRSVFERLGGFPAVDTLEDVLFSECLQRNGVHPVILDLEVTTDSRKFEQMGVWRGLARCVVIQVRHRLGLRPAVDEPFFQDLR